MARRRRDDDEGEEVVQTPDRKIVPAKVLKSLLKSDASAQESIDEISGQMGSAIKQAVEKHGLNPRAYRKVKAMNRMSIEKAKIEHEDYELYMEASGLLDRFAEIQTLPGMGKGEEAEEEEVDGDGKVTNFPRGASIQ